MKQTQLTNLLIDQSKDIFWIINSDFHLIYANKRYLSSMKEVNGEAKKLNESIFTEGSGDGYTEKWKAYYSRAFQGEYFEEEEHVYHPNSDQLQYTQVTFEPLTGEDDKIFAVACQSKDITRVVKEKSEESQLIDASLDVFCTVNEQGKFIYVSAASLDHWGYLPVELIGKSYKDLILEEDLSKTSEIIDSIHSSLGIKSFVNRYKKKDGSIAYNLWSARWDDRTKLRYAVARDGKEKIKQEEAILLSEQRYKALVQEGYDLFAIINMEGNYTYMSPSSTTIIGIPPEEFIGRDAFEFVHPDDAERTLASIKKLASEDRVTVPSYRARNQRNEWRWVETVLTNMIDNPSINGIVVNSRDITDKVEQEEKILHSEQRFKALVQEGSDLIGILDAAGNYIYISPTSTSVLGITPEEFMGRNAFEFIHPDDKERTLGSLQKLAIENRVILEPFRFQNHKKEWRWLETVLTNMLDNPAVNGIVANSRDITAKIEEEQKLKLLESVITNTNDSILITEAVLQDDSGPRIIYANAAFTKMTGYEAAEVIGRTPSFLHGANTDKVEMARLSTAIKNWEPCEITAINYKKSGEEFWINFSIMPVPDGKGSFTHWFAIQRDVTEKKSKELEKNLINEISDIFHQNIDNDLTACLTIVCEDIAKFGDFEFAEIWLPASDGKTINLVTNYISGTAGNVFHKASKNLKSSVLGEGMAGHIWKIKKTGIWEDVDVEWQFFKRKIAAKKAGVRAIMGVPLKDKKEIIGVLLIGTEKTKSASVHYSELLQKLEYSIGAELSRKKIEIELAQIFTFTPGIICVAGFDGYLKRINPTGLELLGYSLEEMKSRPIRSFIHEEDRLQTKEQQTNLYNGRRQSNFENRYITNEGKIVWLSWNAISLPEHGILYAVAKDITEEKKLRELNRQTRSMAKIGSWEFDIVNQSHYWSDEVYHMLDIEPKSIVQDLEKDINFYREDFRELAKISFEKCISTCEPFDIEVVAITSKKKEIWIRAIGNAEFADGICKRVYGSFQDISDRKEAEIRLRSLSENIPGVIYKYVIHPDGTDAMMHISGGTKQLWGYETDEITANIDLLWDQIRLGGEIEAVKASIFKSIQTKSRWTCRFKTVISTGELKTHFGTGTPTFLADGTIVFDVIILDVTQEAKNEELLEQTTKIARIGSWEMDLTTQGGDSMYWSPMLFEIVELDDSFNPTLTGGIEFHIGESKERIRQALNLLISDGIEFDVEILLLTAKGNERWFRAIGKSEEVNNKRTKIYGSYQDISGQKNMELQLSELNEVLQQHTLELERSNEELEQFAFVASHDLQEPLRMISSFMDLLNRKYGHLIDEKGHQYIHFATDGAKRMKQIILDLLDYSRASKSIEEKADVDINELLSEFRQLRRKIISEKSASIISNDLPILKTYKVAIMQIINCLLDNALTYTKAGTPLMIEINAVENEKEWEFSIKDNGIGIEPQFYDKIFVLFQRLHNRDQYEGTGIGLSIAKKHVELLGGRIWLESKLGEGTMFYFAIPKTI
jgi:PAS domain S-box-containing protein